MRPARNLIALCLLLSAAPLTAEEGTWTSIGPEGRHVAALAVAPSRPFIVFAGVEGLGLYRSADRGQTWARAGLPGEIFDDLAVDPANPETVIAATRHGLYKTDSRGIQFQLLFTDALDRVQALSFVPGQSGVLLAGAANGLWKSTDAGRSWLRVGTKPGRITALAVDPRTPRVIYAGIASGALFKSTDSGLTWLRLRAGQGVPVSSLEVDPANSSIVYAGLGRRLFRSLDRGATWRVGPSLPGRPGIALAASRSELLAGTSSGLFVSPDRGLTFQALQPDFPPPPVHDLALDRQDPPRLYVRVNSGLFKTADRGGSWSFLGPPESLDDPAFAFSPSMAVATDGSETLYLGQERRVARSVDGGRTWSYVQNYCLVFRNLLLDPREASHVYADGFNVSGGCGRIPYAIFSSTDGGGTWTSFFGLDLELLGIDGTAVYIQNRSSGNLFRLPVNPDTEPLFPGLSAVSFAPSLLVPGRLWAGRLGEVGRSEDGGQTWSFSSAGLPAGRFVDDLALDPADPDTLYAATAVGAFKSTDAGTTWTPVGAWPAGVVLQGGLDVDPADPSILYAGTDVGVLLFDQED